MTSAGRRGPRRGRNGKTVRRTGPTTLRAVPAAPVGPVEYALDAELAGAVLMAMVSSSGDDLVPAFV